MDDIVKDVNDGWSDDEPSRPLVMQYVSRHDISLVIKARAASRVVMII
jgi:hypothetical protein